MSTNINSKKKTRVLKGAMIPKICQAQNKAIESKSITNNIDVLARNQFSITSYYMRIATHIPTSYKQKNNFYNIQMLTTFP